MEEERFALLDGRLQVYRRKGSKHWHCAATIGGRQQRVTTTEESLHAAKSFATDWYAERCVDERRQRRGLAPLDGTVELPAGTGALPVADGRRRRTPSGPTFREAAEAFIKEYTVVTLGERNAKYVKQKGDQIRLHLNPFFGDKPVASITAGDIQEYRVHRQTPKLDPRTGKEKKPARSTLHSETVTLRQIMKTANRKGWIAALPDMSVAYKSSGKVSHRAWFSPAEYKMLYEATRERAKNPKKERGREVSEQLHDYVLFMGNTGLRPDEAQRLQSRDVEIVHDEATGERILEIEVRGKRGVGYCKSMPGAVHPFLRTRQRKALKPNDLVYGVVQRELFNSVLRELGLKTRPRWQCAHRL